MFKLAVGQEEHLPSQRRCNRCRESDTEYTSVVVWACLKDIGVNIHLAWKEKGFPERLKQASHWRVNAENEIWVVDCYYLPFFWWFSMFFEGGEQFAMKSHWGALPPLLDCSVARFLLFINCRSWVTASSATVWPWCPVKHMGQEKTWPEAQLESPGARAATPAQASWGSLSPVCKAKLFAWRAASARLKDLL